VVPVDCQNPSCEGIGPTKRVVKCCYDTACRMHNAGRPLFMCRACERIMHFRLEMKNHDVRPVVQAEERDDTMSMYRSDASLLYEFCAAIDLTTWAFFLSPPRPARPRAGGRLALSSLVACLT
jgi:hypothetical protein